MGHGSPPASGLAPYVVHVERHGASETWVLQRKTGFGDLAIRGCLWLLRLLCLALVVLLGFAVATRPLTIGGVVFAIACLPVLWGLWRVLGVGLELDGVSRVELASDGRVVVSRHEQPQRLEVRCSPGALLRAQTRHQSVGQVGFQRWVDLRLDPGGQAEPIYLGFLALKRVSSATTELAEDEATWSAALALAEHLGVGFEASARGK